MVWSSCLSSLGSRSKRHSQLPLLFGPVPLGDFPYPPSHVRCVCGGVHLITQPALAAPVFVSPWVGDLGVGQRCGPSLSRSASYHLSTCCGPQPVLSGCPVGSPHAVVPLESDHSQPGWAVRLQWSFVLADLSGAASLVQPRPSRVPCSVHYVRVLGFRLGMSQVCSLWSRGPLLVLCLRLITYR